MKIRSWWRTEWRRGLALLPSLILRAAILTLIAGMAFLAVFMLRPKEAASVTIGYCAPEDELTNLAVTYVKELDSLRGWCSLVPYASDKEGLSALESGELSALLVLPDGVAEGIINGTNEPARLYLGGDSKALGLLFEEAAAAGVHMLAVAQAEIYTGYDVLSASGVETAQLQQQYQRIDRHNLDIVMNREQLFERESLSAYGSSGMAVYYGSALLALYLLLCGLFLGRYCSRSRLEADIVRWRLGVPYVVQNICHTLVAAAGMAFCLMLPALLWLFPAVRKLLTLPRMGIRGGIVLLLLLLCAGAYAELIYALAGEKRTALTIMGMSALIQGYVAGCFIPSALLPQAIDKASVFIPATYFKAAATLLLSGKTQQFSLICRGLLIWLLLFMLARALLLLPHGERTLRGAYHSPFTSLTALWFRRLLQNRGFWLCLLVTSVSSFVILQAEEKSDTVIYAAFYTENESYAGLLTAYEGLVQFCQMDSEEAVKRQVVSGEAEYGCVIPADMGRSMQAADYGSSVQVWEAEDAVFTGMIDEVVFSLLYQESAQEWFGGYMEALGCSGSEAEDALLRRLADGSTFSFERQVLQSTQSQDSGEATYPLWIIAVLQTLLCGLTGLVQTLRDRRRHYAYKRSYVVSGIIAVILPMLVAALWFIVLQFLLGSW